MLFLGIISWEGASHFNGGFVFQMGGASFLSWGGAPRGGIGFDGRGFKKNCRMMGGGGGPPMPPPPPTVGNPRVCNNTGSVLNLQLILGNLSFIFSTNDVQRSAHVSLVSGRYSETYIHENIKSNKKINEYQNMHKKYM